MHQAPPELTPLAGKIHQTWKISRPNAIARMKAMGTLAEELNEAADQAAEIHESLFRQGVPPLQAMEVAAAEWQNLEDE